MKLKNLECAVNVCKTVNVDTQRTLRDETDEQRPFVPLTGW